MTARNTDNLPQQIIDELITPNGMHGPCEFCFARLVRGNIEPSVERKEEGMREQGGGHRIQNIKGNRCLLTFYALIIIAK